ncbi:MAG: ABC transporter permease [Spirochaetales bacterium]|nr:ABC transporter permease [Spirochaetales bacterium]MCF7937401.1 ABC transporter permease [Spirochaetales bacterium]
MRNFLIRKVIASIVTLYAIVTANFVIFRMAPGDPIRMMFRDPRVSAEQLAEQTEKFGLSGSLWDQYLAYMGNLLQGDLGLSFWQKRPVIDVIAERIPQTLMLVLTALALAVLIGTFFGALAGWKSGKKTDSIILSTSLTLYSIPSFAMGIVLLMVFAYILTIFPLGGIRTPASGFTGIRSVLDVLWHMILPAFSIILWYVGEYILLTRSSMLDVLGQDYILTARAKGLRERLIRKRHALRNALLPVITITGVNLGFAVAGIIEAETVFSWPGVGRLIYDAVLKRDYPLLQGVFLVFAAAIILANFVIDLIYSFVDPRIRVGE